MSIRTVIKKIWDFFQIEKNYITSLLYIGTFTPFIGVAIIGAYTGNLPNIGKLDSITKIQLLTMGIAIFTSVITILSKYAQTKAKNLKEFLKINYLKILIISIILDPFISITAFNTPLQQITFLALSTTSLIIASIAIYYLQFKNIKSIVISTTLLLTYSIMFGIMFTTFNIQLMN